MIVWSIYSTPLVITLLNQDSKPRLNLHEEVGEVAEALLSFLISPDGGERRRSFHSSPLPYTCCLHLPV